MALFGAGMLYNHMHPKNLDNYWHSTPNIDAETYRDIYAHPFTTYTEVEYVANRPIRMGEELFASYGEGSEWFTARGIELSPLDYDPSSPPLYSQEFLVENGHCMSNIEVKNSSIPLAGQGIFARKAFKKGEIVSISPVLVIPKHDLESTASHSVFFNYCFLVPDTDLALFSFGLAGLINHGGISSNVEIDWFDWSSLSSSPPARLNWTAQELEENPFAPLDFQYIATQDIAPGEEILLNYGLKWEEAWELYLEGLKQYWLEFGSSGVVIGPQFRSSMEITSEMLFPPHLQSTPCVGKHGCGSSKIDFSNDWRQKHLKAREREVRQREYQKGKDFIQKHFQISVDDNNKEASSSAGGEL